MNLAIFDSLECACGERELALEGPVTEAVPLTGPITHVLCKSFCGYKHCSIATGQVSPQDCLECRSRQILGGTIRCGCGQEWPIVNGSPQFATSGSTSSSGDGLRTVETNWRTDPRWRSFVAVHPEGTVYQHPSWLRILCEEYGQDCVTLACEDSNGRLHALLPLVYTRGMPSIFGGTRTTRRISSLPRTPVAGPLSISARARTVLLQAAIDRVRRDPHLQLELKTQEQESGELVEGMVRLPWRRSYILHLPENPKRLELGNSHERRHRIRWAVKKAVRSGVHVRPAETEGELEEWYELYLDTMRRKVVPPRPYRLFHAMWEELHRRGLMQLLLAERDEGGQTRILAGSIFLKLRHTVFYAFTGCRRADFSLHPHDLIQWNAIQGAVREGYGRYDFGEVADDSQSLANFKAKWGADEQFLYRYYYPAPKNLEAKSLPVPAAARKVVENVWRRLPLSVTARIGDALYSYL